MGVKKGVELGVKRDDTDSQCKCRYFESKMQVLHFDFSCFSFGGDINLHRQTN